jgi:hypothetical protein
MLDLSKLYDLPMTSRSIEMAAGLDAALGAEHWSTECWVAEKSVINASISIVDGGSTWLRRDWVADTFEKAFVNAALMLGYARNSLNGIKKVVVGATNNSIGETAVDAGCQFVMEFDDVVKDEDTLLPEDIASDDDFSKDAVDDLDPVAMLHSQLDEKDIPVEAGIEAKPATVATIEQDPEHPMCVSCNKKITITRFTKLTEANLPITCLACEDKV